MESKKEGNVINFVKEKLLKKKEELLAFFPTQKKSASNKHYPKDKKAITNIKNEANDDYDTHNDFHNYLDKC